MDPNDPDMIARINAAVRAQRTDIAHARALREGDIRALEVHLASHLTSTYEDYNAALLATAAGPDRIKWIKESE